MRIAVLVLLIIVPLTASGQELNKQQKEVWSALEEQVGLDKKQDWEGMKKFIHPKGCFWGDNLPAPVLASEKTDKYYAMLRAGEEEMVGQLLVPVSVVVVDDVAIINCYAHGLFKTKDGEQVERVMRLHNTWKKHEGRWKLLSVYNTVVEADD